MDFYTWIGDLKYKNPKDQPEMHWIFDYPGEYSLNSPGSSVNLDLDRQNLQEIPDAGLDCPREDGRCENDVYTSAV